MKRNVKFGLMLLSTIALTSCAYHKNPYLNENAAQETWLQEVDTTSVKWTEGADSWFFTGEPSAIEKMNMAASDRDAVSTMLVRVPDTFTNIRTNGAFEVQIFGTNDHNSVYLYGPNAGVREVQVKVRGNTLDITQSKDAPRCIDRVIVRIGIQNLNNLVHSGLGKVEGRAVRSDCLYVTSAGYGNIYLAGQMNLKRLIVNSKGSVTVLGAITPDLTINTNNGGNANVSGNVGVGTIVHHGWGDINIIGANTDDLKVDSDGRGKIGIQGQMDISRINARGTSRVYASYLNANAPYVYVRNSARVGLAGVTKHLFVDAGDSGLFFGRCLYAYDAYARAHDMGHINVTARDKIFAAATQNGSVYYFGSPNNMSQFVSGNGMVVPVWGDNYRCPWFNNAPVYKDAVYKDQAPAYVPKKRAYTYRSRLNYKGY